MRRMLLLVMLAMVWTTAAWGKEPGVTFPSPTLFKYDKAQPLEAKVTQMEKSPIRTMSLVTFSTTNGQVVYGYYYVPTRGKAPFPCVIVMHGAGGSKEDFIIVYEYLVTRGYAVFAPDAAFHGDRATEGIDVFKADWYQYRGMVMQTVVDLQRTVDWLQTRTEIDPGRIGYFGISQGSFIGSVFSGTDTRVRATVLLIGGADYHTLFRYSQVPNIALMRNFATMDQMDAVADELSPIDPQYYVGSISPRPVLLMNGSKDYLVSPEGGKRLQELAGEPKETYWFDSGHVPPFDKVLVLATKFLAKNLKNVEGTVKPEAAVEKPAIEKPGLTVDIDRDVKDPMHRVFLLKAKTKKPLPKGYTVAVNFPELDPGDHGIFDDGTHGDAKAGDGVWSMKFEFGPYPPDLDLVGGPKYYRVLVKVLTPGGTAVETVDAGILSGEKIVEETTEWGTEKKKKKK